LGAEKFLLDGRHTGTGGGNHIVLGGPTPADSPFLRRPDLLRSLVTYWINHPSLSYLFSGQFIGPTSQAPRVDETRIDCLPELEIAFAEIDQAGPSCPPWLVDRIFRHLLVDVTGNTHRAEFCIDKLYAPETASGRLGLVEMRAFEMALAPESLTAIVARPGRLVLEEATSGIRSVGNALADHSCSALHSSRFQRVIQDLKRDGYPFDSEWYATQFEFRYPHIGTIERAGIKLELRCATEPWYVLGEEPAGGAMARFVDSSVERLQVKVNGFLADRYVVTCNNRRIPLHPTGTEGEFAAGVRYRAWQPPSCLHPTIEVHTPLVFDVFDEWSQRSLGGCTYHVSHPGGRSHETFPINAYEAESRRAARFFGFDTPGPLQSPPREQNPRFPMTLDLRRRPST
jgi:uncharacterized protein (DUF2126 family)